MNPPTTLPEALEQIEELKREVKYTQTNYTDAKRDAEKLQDEMEDLRGSCGSPEALQAFGDKWAKLRNGFIGHADGPIWIGVAVMLAVNLALLTLCHALIARGYKLKA